jgi:CheY-like chemotaxis protein
VVVPAPIEGLESGAKARTILIVEDEVLIRMMISEALRSRGFAVIEAATAEEALIVLQSETPVSLLLSDIRLPGVIDGVALAAWARANKPEVKIVMAASHHGLTAKGAVDAAFDKPYDLDEVGDCIANLLAAR